MKGCWLTLVVVLPVVVVTVWGHRRPSLESWLRARQQSEVTATVSYKYGGWLYIMCYIYIYIHMGVSESGTPKSSILIGFSIKPSILGYPYFWKHPYTRTYIYMITCIHFLPESEPTGYRIWRLGSGFSKKNTDRNRTVFPTKKFLNHQTWQFILKINPWFRQDDFPFPKVEYISSLKGIYSEN